MSALTQNRESKSKDKQNQIVYMIRGWGEAYCGATLYPTTPSSFK